MEKWMIVDGSNLLFQMFYGMPARITGRNGKAIQVYANQFRALEDYTVDGTRTGALDESKI